MIHKGRKGGKKKTPRYKYKLNKRIKSRSQRIAANVIDMLYAAINTAIAKTLLYITINSNIFCTAPRA